MTKEILLLLLLSVTLSAGRNVISKKTAISILRRSSFFFSQTVLFGTAAFLLLILYVTQTTMISSITLICGLIYGVLLILSQWMLTIALRYGNTSVCTVVYSLGFIIPTVSGVLFWDESFTVLNAAGCLIAVAVILLSSPKSDSVKDNNKSFFFYIITAMISSGGLGAMQKIQQSTDKPYEKIAFLLIAFLFAFFSSLFAFCLCHESFKPDIKSILYPVLAGGCFGGANICNTVLAGKMKSAIFFPMQNILTILLSTLLGVLIFKEGFEKKTLAIMISGIAVVIMFSL